MKKNLILSVALAAFFSLFTIGSALAFCTPKIANDGTQVVCFNNPTDKTCSAAQFGTSTMDGDGKNIIACLKNDAGTFEWKTMSKSPGGDLKQDTCHWVYVPCGNNGCDGYYKTTCPVGEYVAGIGNHRGNDWTRTGHISFYCCTAD